MAAEGKRLFSSGAAHGPPPGGAGSPSRCHRSCCLRPTTPAPAAARRRALTSERGAGAVPPGPAGKGGQHPWSLGGGSAAPAGRRSGSERRDPAGSGLTSPRHGARRASELCRGFVSDF